MVTAVNDAPVVDLNGGIAGTGFTSTFTEDGGAVAIVGLGQPDRDRRRQRQHRLGHDHPEQPARHRPNRVRRRSRGCNVGSPSPRTTPGPACLALSGSTSLANYQACLRTLKYNDASQNPNTTDRIVNVKVNDGALDSNTAVATVHVTAVNDAPVANSDAGTTNEDTSLIVAAPGVLGNDTDV